LICEAGTFQNSPGSSDCGSCTPGTYSLSGASICETCSAGLYSAIENATACVPCDVGSFQRSSSGTACQLCPQGTYYPSPGATACLSCPIGEYGNTTGATRCVSCDQGYYQADTGQVSCRPCEIGSALGGIGCTPCPLGRYNDREAQPGCFPCSSGKYQDSAGQSTCKPCKQGKISTFSSIGIQVCTGCGQRTVAPQNGSDQCYSCGVNADSDPERVRCACESGFYGREGAVVTNDTKAPRPLQCTKCEVALDCSKPGVYWDEVSVRAGWWRASTNSTEFFRCLNIHDCVGGHGSSCSSHRTGPICATCEKGYRSTTGASGADCVRCPSKGESVGVTIVVIIVVVFALAVGYMYVIWSDKPLVLLLQKHEGWGKGRELQALDTKFDLAAASARDMGAKAGSSTLQLSGSDAPRSSDAGIMDDAPPATLDERELIEMEAMKEDDRIKAIEQKSKC